MGLCNTLDMFATFLQPEGIMGWERQGQRRLLTKLMCSYGLNSWVFPCSEIFLQDLQSVTAPR